MESLLTKDESALYFYESLQDINFRITLYLKGIPEDAYACFFVNDYVTSDVGLTKRDEISVNILPQSVVWNYVRVVEYTDFNSIWSLFDIWEHYKTVNYIMTNEDELV